MSVSMPTAMQQIQAERAGRPDDLVASGLMVEMRFKPGRRSLSLRAAKMLHLLIKAAGADLCKTIVHSISLKEIRRIAMISRVDIKEIAEELTDTKIEIHAYYPKETWSLGSILSGAKLHITDSELSYRFSDAMIELFSLDDRWTVISKTLILEFESRYALRLYEMLALRKNLQKNTEEFEVDDLRSRLGVEFDKLKPFGHFKSYALDPAVNEVNRITDIRVSYELVKKSRSVRSIKLQWSTRATIESEGISEAAPADVASPATKPSAFKSAPIEPEAERDIPEPPRPRFAFPVEGSIRDHHPWQEIAETHCPGYDMDLLSKGFRSMAGRKQDGFPLKGPDLEDRFVAYCRTKAFATASARARQAALGRQMPEPAAEPIGAPAALVVQSAAKKRVTRAVKPIPAPLPPARPSFPARGNAFDRSPWREMLDEHAPRFSREAGQLAMLSALVRENLSDHGSLEVEGIDDLVVQFIRRHCNQGGR